MCDLWDPVPVSCESHGSPGPGGQESDPQAAGGGLPKGFADSATSKVMITFPQGSPHADRAPPWLGGIQLSKGPGTPPSDSSDLGHLEPFGLRVA